MRETFSKKEKLCSKKAIDHLFIKGKSIYIYPFKLIYLLSNEECELSVKVLISIPKKYVRHAVDRNRMKRLVRESYRKQKNLLMDSKIEGKVTMAFIYTGKNLASYSEIDRVINEMLMKSRALLENETINNPT